MAIDMSSTRAALLSWSALLPEDDVRNGIGLIAPLVVTPSADIASEPHPDMYDETRYDSVYVLICGLRTGRRHRVRGWHLTLDGCADVITTTIDSTLSLLTVDGAEIDVYEVPSLSGRCIETIARRIGYDESPTGDPDIQSIVRPIQRRIMEGAPLDEALRGSPEPEVSPIPYLRGWYQQWMMSQAATVHGWSSPAVREAYRSARRDLSRITREMERERRWCIKWREETAHLMPSPREQA